VDSGGGSKQHCSLAIGSDGEPVITYYDIPNDWLKVVHCATAAVPRAVVVVPDSPAPPPVPVVPIMLCTGPPPQFAVGCVNTSWIVVVDGVFVINKDVVVEGYLHSNIHAL